MTENHLNAIVKNFGLENQDQIEQEVRSWDHYGLDIIEIDGIEYAFAPDDAAADLACFEYLETSLWAFNSDFLAGETDLPVEVFKALSQKCEDGNDPIRKLVDKTCGLQSLVDSAIGADGRGHFLASYDGDEIELSSGGFLYRI